MKQLLDSVPALVFLAGVLLQDIYTATLWLMISLVLLVVFYRVAESRWHKLHLGTAVVAVVLGSITLSVRDPIFIKYKPTVIYGAIAAALLISHVWGARVLLQRLPQKVIELPDSLWRKVNFAWALFFLAIAGINVALALTLSDEHWALARTFGLPVLWFAFVLSHLPWVAPYMKTEQQEATDVVRDHRP